MVARIDRDCKGRAGSQRVRTVQGSRVHVAGPQVETQCLLEPSSWICLVRLHTRRGHLWDVERKDRRWA